MAWDTIKIMNYTLAMTIKLLNPAETEDFVIEHRQELIESENDLIGSVDIRSYDEIDAIDSMDTNELNDIKSSLIWYLCFTDEEKYCGIYTEEISYNDWDKQETNISFIDHYYDESSELLYTIIDDKNIKKLFETTLYRKEWFEKRYGHIMISQIYLNYEKMKEIVSSNSDLRLAYFYDY